ncbi:DNA polymerase family X lyase domain [Phytophthora cactorum]|nr:DNA polymerase family X lyase domain [Phytophthora cactorum]
MKVETTISDLLMKCEEQGVHLPEPVAGAARDDRGIADTKHHGLGYLQIPKAFDQLKSKYNEDADALKTETAAPRVVHRQKRALMDDMPKRNHRNMILDSDSDSDETSALIADIMSPVASSKKKTTKYPKKSRIQEQVQATPAVKDENQPLVDQLVQLGEHEMTHGYTQRGLARFRAAKEICNSQIVITSGAQAKKLDHVGPAAATKVDQLLNEGLRLLLDELQQKYGLELAWKQHLENEEGKRQRRRQSRQKKSIIPTKDPRLSNFAMSAQGSKSKGGVMTPSKRPSASQEQQNAPMKVAKKAKNARELIVPEASNESEEKQPSTEKKPAAGQDVAPEVVSKVLANCWIWKTLMKRAVV